MSGRLAMVMILDILWRLARYRKCLGPCFPGSRARSELIQERFFQNKTFDCEICGNFNTSRVVVPERVPSFRDAPSQILIHEHIIRNCSSAFPGVGGRPRDVDHFSFISVVRRLT
jgi:hypothetical protein